MSILAVAGRPDLWSTALRQVQALLPNGWWRRWPPSLMPPPAYLHFRLLTMYGDPDADLSPADVVGYLEWCKRMRGTAR